MSELVVIDASVLLAIALPDPQANKDYAMALLFAIDTGDIAPVLTQLCHHEVAAKLVRKVRGQLVAATKAREFFELMGDISFQHVISVTLKPCSRTAWLWAVAAMTVCMCGPLWTMTHSLQPSTKN